MKITDIFLAVILVAFLFGRLNNQAFIIDVGFVYGIKFTNVLVGAVVTGYQTVKDRNAKLNIPSRG